MTGPTVVDFVAGNSSVRIEPSKSVCRQGQLTKKSFQYPDDMRGYWAFEEQKRPIVRRKLASPAQAKRPTRVG